MCVGRAIALRAIMRVVKVELGFVDAEAELLFARITGRLL